MIYLKTKMTFLKFLFVCESIIRDWLNRLPWNTVYNLNSHFDCRNSNIFLSAEPHSLTLPSLHLRRSSFSKPFLASPTSQIIFQPFRRFTYVIAHSSTLPSLHLCNGHFTYVTWRDAHGCQLHNYVKFILTTLYYVNWANIIYNFNTIISLEDLYNILREFQ